jgi:hypothetical protein
MTAQTVGPCTFSDELEPSQIYTHLERVDSGVAVLVKADDAPNF